MKDRHRRSRRHPHRMATRRHRHHPAAPPPAAEAPLLGVLREALRAPEPTQFWVAAAPLVTILEEPGELADSLPEGVDLLETMIEVNVAETTALLHMVVAMSRDDLLRERARRALPARRQPVPAHVSGLVDAQVSLTRVFGDSSGDNLMVELTLPGQVQATLMLYVTRVPHLYLKDAYVVPSPLWQVQEYFAQTMAAEGFVLDDALMEPDPAQVRIALEQALAGIRPGIEKEPEEEDQWPMLRPFVEFVISRMPAGDAGYDEHGLLAGQDPGSRLDGGGPTTRTPLESSEAAADDGPGSPWTDEDGTDLAQSFLASPQAAGLEEHELTGPVVRSLMLIAVEYTEDPLGWDLDAVRWALEEALPAEPLLPRAGIDLVSTVLPALVAWSHEVRAVDRETSETVRAALPPLLSTLPQRWEDPRAQSERIEAALDLALANHDPVLLRSASLAAHVGGFEALDELGTAPLPTEPLQITAIPTDLHDKAREIDAQLVAGLDQLDRTMLDVGRSVLGEEFLTACRRFLVRVAVHDPVVLRRRASIRTTAAAIAWILGRGNQLVGSPPAPVRTGDLMGAFGQKATPGQRADSLTRAAALPQGLEGVVLGSADLLVASAREEIIEARELLEEA